MKKFLPVFLTTMMLSSSVAGAVSAATPVTVQAETDAQTAAEAAKTAADANVTLEQAHLATAQAASEKAAATVKSAANQLVAAEKARVAANQKAAKSKAYAKSIAAKLKKATAANKAALTALAAAANARAAADARAAAYAQSVAKTVKAALATAKQTAEVMAANVVSEQSAVEEAQTAATAAKAALDKIVADKAAAAAVSASIVALPAVTAIAVTDATAINAANAAYIALSADQKAYVSAADKATLDAAVARLGVLQSTPSVASVIATNLKEIVVVFNKDVDATTATTNANYTLSAGAVSSVALNADNKSVTITLTAAAAQQASVDVTVTNVKDYAGTTIATTTKNVVLADTTIPSVTNVAVTGPKEVTVTFSEPMNTVPTFVVNGGSYSLTSVLATDGKSARVTLATTLPAGSNTVQISGGADFATYSIPSVTKTVNYVADTVAPTVTLKSITQTGAVLKFSKAVSLSGGVNGTDFVVYHTINNSTAYDADTYTWNSDNTELTLTFTSRPIAAGAVTLYVANAKVSTTNQLQDAWGNALASTTLTGTVTADTVAPTVTSVAFVDSTHIDVTFSESLDAATVVPADFVLKDSSGNAVAVSAAVGQNSGTQVYRLTTGTLNGDTYTLTIAGGAVADSALVANTNAAYSKAIVVSDTAAPTVSNVQYNGGKTKLFVTYSEAMATTGVGSVLDTANYRYTTTNGATPTGLPAGTTITALSGNKTVVINLPATNAGIGTGALAALTIGQVKDASGNATDNVYTTFTMVPAAVSASNIVSGSVKATSTGVITFQVNTELSAIDTTKFAVNGATSAASATYVNSNGVATVTLTAGNGATWDTGLVNLNANAVSVSYGAMTDINGIGVTAGFVIAKTTVLDYVAPTIVSRNATGSTVYVAFSEAIETNSIAYDSFTVEGYTVSGVQVLGNYAILTVTANITGTPKVQLVKPARDASSQRNVIAAETSGTALGANLTNITPVNGYTTITTAGTSEVTPSFLITLDPSYNYAGGVENVYVSDPSLSGVMGQVLLTPQNSLNAAVQQLYTGLTTLQTLTAAYNVTTQANAIVLTRKVATAATLYTFPQAGLTTSIATTTIASYSAGVNQVDTYTVTTAGSVAQGILKVTIGGVQRYVGVASGSTPTTVASNIALAFNGSLPGYTITSNGATIIFTSSLTGSRVALPITIE